MSSDNNYFPADALSPQDLESLAKSYITPDVAEIAQLCRVDSQTGAEIVGQKSNNGRSFAGIVFPYFSPVTKQIVESRLRRDSPDLRRNDQGEIREECKYLGPPQRRPRAYFTPLSIPFINAQTVAIVEGEKKALALCRYFRERSQEVLVIGIAGVNAWSGTIGKVDDPLHDRKQSVRGFLPDLEIGWKDRQVLIIFDANVHTNPQVRRARGKLTRALSYRGANVFHIDIPAGLPGVNGIDDLLGIKGADFVDALFEQQLAKAEARVAEFYAGEDQDFARVMPQVWDALEESEGLSERTLFWSGGAMTRLQGQVDRVQIEALTVDRFLYRLVHLAKWFVIKKASGRPRAKKEGEAEPEQIPKIEKKLSAPPLKLARLMLAAPMADTPLPLLHRVTYAPIFLHSGQLLTQAGFHQESGIYYFPTFDTKELPEDVTKDQVDAAVKWLDEEILTDFPFAAREDRADRANTLGLMLLPFVREMIPGPTPLHMIEASTPGSGKGLLAAVALFPALGEAGVANVTQPEDDAEWAKLITTHLVAGKGAILVDNVNDRLDRGDFCSALTARYWDNRKLGGNESANVRIRCVWLATANNPEVSDELARRVVRIRLEPHTETPEARDGFRHENLMSYVKENRADYVRNLLIVAKYWVQQGMPNGKRKHGTYEDWVAVIGGILETAGVAGFMGNYEEFREQAVVERSARGDFCNEWWERLEEEKRLTELQGLSKTKWRHAKAADLYEFAQHIEGLPIEAHNPVSGVRSLGKYLSKNAGMYPEVTVYDDCERPIWRRKFHIKKGRVFRRAQLWELELESQTPLTD